MKVICLDIDNTLLSFNEYVKQTMKTGFAEFGLKAYEPYMYELFTEENNKLWRQIEDGTLTFQELEKIRWNKVFEAIGISFDGVVFEKYFREALHESAIPEEGAYELLEYLSQKYIVCAASNGPYEQQIHRLEIANMRKYFDYIFVSEQVGASKPATAFFEYAFREINQDREEPIAPEECLMVGDSLTSDVEGGRRYGMKTCLYRKGAGASVPKGVRVAADLKELMLWL